MSEAFEENRTSAVGQALEPMTEEEAGETGCEIIYFADTRGIQDSLRKGPPWSMAADPPSNRGMPLISIALSLGLWAGIWVVFSSLIWR